MRLNIEEAVAQLLACNLKRVVCINAHPEMSRGTEVPAESQGEFSAQTIVSGHCFFKLFNRHVDCKRQIVNIHAGTAQNPSCRSSPSDAEANMSTSKCCLHIRVSFAPPYRNRPVFREYNECITAGRRHFLKKFRPCRCQD